MKNEGCARQRPRLHHISNRKTTDAQDSGNWRIDRRHRKPYRFPSPPLKEFQTVNRKLKALTPDQFTRYQEDGGIAPVKAFRREEAESYRAQLESFERKVGIPLMKYPARPTIWSKSHLLFTWIDSIVRHPAILDVVEDLTGPNIRVFHNNVFIKEPHSPEFITWHQDGAYNGVSPPEVLTIWVALSEASVEMGCMKMLKGSHKHGLRVHADRKAAHNLLTRGQQIDIIEKAPIIDLALMPGEMSVHHSYAV